MNPLVITTPRPTTTPAAASEPVPFCKEAGMSLLHANQRRSSSATSHLKPLALALALAVGAGAPAERAAGYAPTRPDGALLWPVTNCDDAGDGSLRDAAAHANHGDGIDLSSLTCSTISVTSGAITLHDVHLFGPGAGQLEISGTGNQNRRIFNHSSGGGTLDISGVTVSGGKYISNAGLGGGCLRSTGGSLYIHDSVFRSCLVVTPVGQAGNARGGAIASYGSGDVRLYGTTIESSLARTDHGIAAGGGVYAQGSVGMYASTIASNSVSASATARPYGGGLVTKGWLWMEDSTLYGNTAAGDGGGAVVYGGGLLRRSTISSNHAVSGTSGIVMLGDNDAMIGIYSSTVSGNASTATQHWLSGALFLNAAVTTITNCTITGNTESNQAGTKFGAGIVVGYDASTFSMSGTIVAGNYFDDGAPPYADDDIDGPDGFTILGDTNMVGWTHIPVPTDTLFESAPRLGPLQDNGGPTLTHLPLPDSPAIDHGAAHGMETDQRGLARVQGVAADIGAVETQPDVIFADDFDAPH
jgi:hypothetical protein